jgi:hypothetical protein
MAQVGSSLKRFRMCSPVAGAKARFFQHLAGARRRDTETFRVPYAAPRLRPLTPGRQLPSPHSAFPTARLSSA